MRRALMATLVALLLGGCSTVKLGYNNLDTLANWAMDDAVAFNPAQENLFDAEFLELWRWHRQTQLPLYAADLRELATQASGPMSVSQVRAYVQRANRHFLKLLEAGTAPAARWLATIEDAQIDGMLEKSGGDRKQRQTARAAMMETEWRAAAADDLRKALKPWVGRLSDEQATRLGEWSQAVRVSPQQWVAFRSRWETAFRTLLATRAAPGFETRVRKYFENLKMIRGVELNRGIERDNETWMQFMSDLSAQLSPAQRERFRNKLLELAEDLDELAAEPIAVSDDGHKKVLAAAAQGSAKLRRQSGG